MNNTEANHQERSQWTAVILIFVLFYVFIITRNAWLGDDAYITFRTVTNFVHGYGLSYNAAERVQSYTHPLWMVLLTFNYFIFREFYFTTIGLSMLLSAAMALVLAFGIARAPLSAILAVGILPLSKAFVDYSTSGLENPLSHLLVVVYFAVYFSRIERARRVQWLCLLASLAMLNRIDIVFLYLPSLLIVFCEHRRGFSFMRVLFSFMPLIIWEAFSLIYYGFPLPNTAYAKVFTGLPALAMIEQGFYYLLNSLSLDPITLFVITISILLTLFTRTWSLFPLAFGVLLYLLYVVQIGGDFMTGRFLSTPLIASIVLLSRLELPKPATAGLALVAVMIGLNTANRPLLNEQPFQSSESFAYVDRNGIADERAFYYSVLGLLRMNRNSDFRRPSWPRKARADVVPTRTVSIRDWVGMYGFNRRPDDHIIDRYALLDPLLARLPAKQNPYWRIGHMTRHVPEGYVQALETGVTHLADQDLAEYHDRLSLLTRGRLFTLKRFKTIAAFNLGRYDHLIDRPRFADPYTYELAVEPNLKSIANNLIPENPANHLIDPEKGLLLKFKEPVWINQIELTVDGRYAYDVSIRRGEEELISAKTNTSAILPMPIQPLELPEELWARGVDGILITPPRDSGPAVFGELRVSYPEILLIEPNGGPALRSGAPLEVRWQTGLENWTRVRFELWRSDRKVADLGEGTRAKDDPGPQTDPVRLPTLEAGGEYSLRVVSDWDDRFHDQSDEPLTVAE